MRFKAVLLIDSIIFLLVAVFWIMPDGSGFDYAASMIKDRAIGIVVVILAVSLFVLLTNLLRRK